MKPVDLSPDARKAAAVALQTWLRDELDQDVGLLQAELLLDHFAATVGPVFYNRGLTDARAVVIAKAEDIDEALYGLERQTTLR